MSNTVGRADEISPLHVDLSQKELDELRQRIGATRWPSKELVDDRSQGVQLATVKSTARSRRDSKRRTSQDRALTCCAWSGS
jgi:hypothetical protein